MRKSFYVTSDRTTHFVQLHLYFYFRFRPGSVGNQIPVIDRDLRAFFLSDTPLDILSNMYSTKSDWRALGHLQCIYISLHRVRGAQFGPELNTRLSPLVCDGWSKKGNTLYGDTSPDLRAAKVVYDPGCYRLMVQQVIELFTE